MTDGCYQVMIYKSVMSERSGGGVAAPVVRVPQAVCWARMKLDIKSFHPEVKVSRSVKRFKRYSPFKIRLFILEISIRLHPPLPTHPIYLTCSCVAACPRPCSRLWQILRTPLCNLVHYEVDNNDVVCFTKWSNVVISLSCFGKTRSLSE